MTVPTVSERLTQWFTNKVRMPNIDISALQRRCTMSEQSYIKELRKAGAEVVYTNAKHDDYYIYQDNGADILAVAHLDTVLPEHRQKFISKKVLVDKNPKDKNSEKVERHIVASTELDDRLGAYIILDYLPRCGLRYDVLLCTNEEIGASTAADFASDFLAKEGRKQYKWIFEFDRALKDVVTYVYGNKKFEDMLEEFFTVGVGSYTDICKLTGLGAAAVNIGTGYNRQHTKECHVFLDDTKYMIKRFLGFYNKYQNTTLPFELVAKRSWTSWSYDDYDDYYPMGRYPTYGGQSASTPKRSFAAVKYVFDFITWIEIPADDAVLLEFATTESVFIHKFWWPEVIDEEGKPSEVLYSDLDSWFWGLPKDERNRIVEEHIQKPSDDTPVADERPWKSNVGAEYTEDELERWEAIKKDMERVKAANPFLLPSEINDSEDENDDPDVWPEEYGMVDPGQMVSTKCAYCDELFETTMLQLEKEDGDMCTTCYRKYGSDRDVYANG